MSRYLAVTQPVKYARSNKRARAFLMIGFSWAVSIGVALPNIFGANNPPGDALREPTACKFYNPDFLIYRCLPTINSHLLCICLLISSEFRLEQ